MPNTLARQLENRPFTAPDAPGVFFTVTRDHSKRKKQWAICRSERVPFKTGFYGNHVEFRKACEWATCSQLTPLSEDELCSILAKWKAEPVKIHNGYPEAYEALFIEAGRRQLPKHYREDLTVYDKQILCSPGWASDDFIWVLRTMGTHIVRLDNPTSLEQAASMVGAIAGGGDVEKYWYHYSHGKLRQIDFERAMRLAKGDRA